MISLTLLELMALYVAGTYCWLTNWVADYCLIGVGVLTAVVDVVTLLTMFAALASSGDVASLLPTTLVTGCSISPILALVCGR
jgi:hypothetical protein